MLTPTPSRSLSSTRSGMVRPVALLVIGCLVALALLTSDASAGQLPVGLGAADSFAALSGTTVTNTGFSTLNGDLGVSPGSALTGFPPGKVNGTVHATDPVANQAQSDLTAAYNDAAGRTPPQALPADVGGRTLAPGVYKSGAALAVTGAVTLDAQGDPNAVFIFQVGSTLTTSVASSVNLIGGAQPCNVSWQIGSSATLGTSSVFAGNILALTSISMNDGVTVNGRALARNGAVTLINDTITAAHCAPGTIGGPTIPGGTTGGPTIPGGTTGGDTRAPEAPVLLSPRAHERVRAGNASFRWRAAARAERYTLMVDHHRMSTGPRTTARMRVRPGSHRFRVIAQNRYGARSSSARRFVARASASGHPSSPGCATGKAKKHRKPTSFHCAFLQRVRAHMPILHVDRTDGFPLKQLDPVFAYRALASGTQPRYTCLRYGSGNDDSSCPRGDQAHLSDLTPRSSVDHIDYPAGFDTDKQKALAARYQGPSTMYFYAKRDGANRKVYTYWFFYSYNYFVFTEGPCPACLQKQVDLHEGDFEHIDVITDAHDKPVLYRFYAHSYHVDYGANDGRLQLNDSADPYPGLRGTRSRLCRSWQPCQ